MVQQFSITTVRSLGLFDTRPVFTYDDLYDYRRDLVDLLLSLSLKDPRMLLLPLLVRYPD